MEGCFCDAALAGVSNPAIQRHRAVLRFLTVRSETTQFLPEIENSLINRAERRLLSEKHAFHPLIIKFEVGQ